MQFTTKATSAVLATLALAGTTMAATLTSATWNTVFSNNLANAGGNQSRQIEQTGTGVIRSIGISGTLRRTATATRADEACIRVRRFNRVAQNISVITHEFIVQPFAQGTNFNGSLQVDIPGGFTAIPVSLSPSMGTSGSYPSMGDNGYWEFEFIETFDDLGVGPSPDAVWDTMTVFLSDNEVSGETPAPLGGTVATTRRFNVRSDDTLNTGSFTGGTISNLNIPAGNTPADRIRFVRISGQLTTQQTAATNSGAFHPTSDARLRLVRRESVLSSPQAPQATTTTEEKFFTVPAGMTSSGSVFLELPIAENDSFGTLARTLGVSPDESGYSREYFVNTYEGTDATGLDNVWNQLKIEFFTNGQPLLGGNVAILGTLPISTGNNGPNTFISNASVNANGPAWFRFTLPMDVLAGGQSYLDLDLEGTTAFDAMMGLYVGAGLNVGNRVAFDDDSGSGQLPQMTFGSSTPRATIGTGLPRNGNFGTLAAGEYFAAVVPYESPTLSYMALDNFRVINTEPGVDRAITFNARSFLPQCGLSDVSGPGQAVGADGQLTADDIIVFLNWYFGTDNRADVAGPGQTTTADGQFTADDIIVFLNRFFAGC